MEADLTALYTDGKINSETMVWREGMSGWQPLREANPALVGAPATPQFSAGTPGILGQVVCSQCGGSFPASEVIRYGTASVCAACKPIFMQKLKEGANVTGGGGSATGWVTEAQVRERDYEHDVGGYLSSAWALFKADAGGLIVATVLVALAVLAANIVPYLSIITGIVFTGPLFGGLFGFYVKKVRSEDAALGDAFSGFGPNFGQLLLGKFIPNLLAGLVLIPVGVIAAILIVTTLGGFHNAGSGGSSGPGPAFGAAMIIAIVLAVVGVCVMVYFQVCWVFTLWLVKDKQMTFWPAMSLSRAVVRKHWWQTFWLGFVVGCLALLGMLLCLVGLLVTGPVCLGMWANAYERLFGDLEPA